ncbi:uncharacterized protein N7511_003916 [Penicillium nucicola]|uniref:uncharacterized protein n=1 Tax=Penicillium nucicola TaxID=1850975 RepID=UPI00254568DD|nr:uncharacterized protein N7511_003916 [Penicillium nucicola]KAJ5766300.1 hypothetical protein N7511_003916 [Penicillium nucicola]
MSVLESWNVGSATKSHLNNTLLSRLAVAFIVYQVIAGWYRYYRSWVNLPVVGAKGLISSRKEGWRWAENGMRILQEGYEKYGDSAFQFRTARRWEVCLCDDALVKEYMSLNDDYMSLDAFNERMFETRYTAPGFAHSLHHIPVPVLSKALAWSRVRTSGKDDLYFQELVDELQFALGSEIPVTSNRDWQELNCLHLGLGLMLRLISKVLVGDPLCRDPVAVNLFVKYGSAVPVSGPKIAWLPTFLKPLLGPYFAASRMHTQLSKLVAQQIRQAEGKTKEPQNIGDWMWKWVEEEAAGVYNEIHVAQLVIAALFGSVHSAGMVLATCLFEITLRPEYIEPLQEEAKRAERQFGVLGREAIESMTKLDSFIKECQRYRPLAPASLVRVATQDYTFKNGLTIPKGTSVLTPNLPMLRDEQYYDRPHEFDGFRFHRLGQATGRPDSFKIAGLSPKSRQFGDGRHTCPGKQLAADMLRLILAHILLNFDIAGLDTKLSSTYPTIDQRFIFIRKRG